MDKFKNEFSVALICSLLDLPRSTYYYSAGKEPISMSEKYQHLEKEVEQIIANNPSYGYRRIRDSLRNDHGYNINHKPLQKLLQEKNWGLKRRVKKKNPSGIESILNELGEKANILRTLKEEEIGVFSVFQTDFTRIDTEAGSVYLVSFIDHKSKIVAGYDISESADTNAVLRAYERLKSFLQEQGVSIPGIIIHSDRGSPFTSYEYVSALVSDDVTPSYSDKGKPGDNSGKESFFGRLKKEQGQIFASAGSIQELIELVAESLRYYNYDRIHSRTNGRSPMDNLPAIFV